MGREYRRVSVDEGNELLDWAEDNRVEYDVYNAGEVLAGSEEMELWLARWPDSVS